MADKAGNGGVLRHRQDGQVVSGSLATLLPEWQTGERWLFITPHDDDPVIAAGMILYAAVSAGVSVSVRIVSDGSMGYTSAVGPDRIVETRRQETMESFGLLGIEDVQWYGYPDSRLHRFQGRWPVGAAGTADIDRDAERPYSGIQDSIVRDLRSLRPGRVLTLAGSDLHPDHRIVFWETRMSVFHAAGDIWPDCGAALGTPPPIYEFAAYSPFADVPDWQYNASADELQRKLDAIRAYRSQTQIAALFASILEAGPVEHMRSVPTESYHPGLYTAFFERA
mgnify:CR=1 FL=1